MCTVLLPPGVNIIAVNKIYLSIYLSTYLSVCLSLSVCPSVCPSVRPPAGPSVPFRPSVPDSPFHPSIHAESARCTIRKVVTRSKPPRPNRVLCSGRRSERLCTLRNQFSVHGLSVFTCSLTCERRNDSGCV